MPGTEYGVIVEGGQQDLGNGERRAATASRKVLSAELANVILDIRHPNAMRRKDSG